MKPRFAALMLAGGLAACASPTSESGSLAVVQDGAELVLTNKTSAPVYYFLVEQGTLALIQMAVCTDPIGCPSIAPRKSLRVPLADITGWTPSAHAIVVSWYYLKTDAWHAYYPVGGGTQTVELH